MESIDLPEPDQFAREHSERLAALLKSRIESSGGQISFADFMHQALYEPGLGYYMAGATKFGADGDFITAPEVSALFGHCLAVQIAEILDALPAHGQGHVLELGAGSGKLAHSIVSSLNAESDWCYFILEPSAELQQRQQQFLHNELPEHLFTRVQWLQALPDSFNGVIVANEVMDALAVERFTISNSGVQQVCVSPELKDSSRPAGDEMIKAIAAIENDLADSLPLGYASEYCAQLPAWIRSLGSCLGSGAMLLIDYGYPRREYYSSERREGSLACYYRHRAHHDPYHLPGLQDITAHVDFTAVASAGVAHGLELLGYAAQSAFLLDNELLQQADVLGAKIESELEHLSLMKQVKTLTLPGEMGERFQVMALGKDYDQPLRGFRTQDLSYRL